MCNAINDNVVKRRKSSMGISLNSFALDRYCCKNLGRPIVCDFFKKIPGFSCLILARTWAIAGNWDEIRSAFQNVTLQIQVPVVSSTIHLTCFRILQKKFEPGERIKVAN